MKSIKFNFVMNFLTTGFSLVFPLITFPYVTRVLGVSAYGDYEFANSCSSFFLLFAQLGIGLYGTRECAKVRDNKSLLAKTTKELFFITATSAAITCLFYILIVFVLPSFRSRALLLLICGMNIPFTILGVSWYFSATEQFGYIAVRTLFVRLIVLLGMFLFVRSSSDCYIWATISVVANSGAYLMNYIKMRSELNWKNVGKLSLCRHIKPLLHFFLAMASISLYSSFSSVLLGVLSTSKEVGFFAAALKIKNVLVAVMSSLTGVLISRSSYYIGHNDTDSYVNIVNKSVHFALTVVCFLAGVLAIFATPVVLFLAGDEYGAAVLPTQLMMVAAIAIGMSSITANEILTPLGEENHLTKSYVISGVVGVVMNIALIPSFGSVGAAIATLVSESLVFLIQLNVVYRKTFFTKDILFRGVSICLVSVVVALILACVIRETFGNTLVVGVLSGLLLSFLILIWLYRRREQLAVDIFASVIKWFK